MREADVAHLLPGGGEMGALVRAFPWERTELGPIATWPQSLRTAVSVCLTSRFAMVVFWGPSLLTLYNDAYRPSFGAKHPHVLGAPAHTLWPEAWHLLGPMMRHVLETGEATWSEDQPLLMDRHGFPEETYWTFSYSPVHGECGQVKGVFTAVSETTQRVLGERRLRTLRGLGTETSRARSVPEALRLTAEVLAENPRDLPFAHLHLATEGRLPRVAAAGEGGEGLAEEVLGPVLDRGAPEVVELPAPAGPVRRALVLPLAPQGRVSRAEGAAPAPGLLVVGLSATLHLDEGYRDFLGLVAGQVATALATATAHEEGRRRAEALAALDRAKTDFFSSVSHEFRTPLTLLLGPVEDALGDAAHPLPPAQRERLELAHRSALRLLKLVNTLLDFSRFEAGRARALYAPTDLAALTADLASTFRSTVEAAGLTLTVRCEPLPAPAWVDREAYEKVVLNLLSNAFKFTLSGGITVSLRAEGGGAEGGGAAGGGAARAVLEVRDTGTGIPAGELPRLFERFHRVAGAQGRSYEGSGIGLSLVQELVRLHGGEVAVESRPGEGTAFTVTLPLGHAHLPPEQLAPPEAPPASASPSTAPHLSPSPSTAVRAEAYVEEARGWGVPAAVPPGPGPHAPALPAPGTRPAVAEAGRGRVLLADDNADVRAYVRRLLEGRWEVEAVEDGARALEAVRARPPDLVLSDVMMPGLDGFGLLRALRGEPRTAALPVVLLSARAGEEARVEGLAAGADDYLVKPFSARELVARVDGALRLAHERAARERLLEERARFAQQLIGIVSHDLRNPVSAILLGASLLLRQGGLAAPQAEGIERIRTSAERVRRMIHDLLDFTQARLAGGMRVRPRPADLHALLGGVLQEVELAHPGRRLELRLGPPAWGEWDPDRLAQVVQNLVTNALKYSPPDSPVRVETRADVLRQEGTEVEAVALSVHNTTTPIGPERLRTLFEPFQRGEDGAVPGGGGSVGLGLYIVRHLVEAHGGTVDVTSSAEEGTTFTVRLPLHPRR
jgi:signal transduction histidine kinase